MCWFFPLSSTTLSFQTRGGLHQPPSPVCVRVMKISVCGRGLKCLRDSASRKPLFLPKTEKHDNTLMSFMTDLSKLASFPFVRSVQIMVWRVLKIWRSVRNFGIYLRKTRGGIALPPPVSRRLIFLLGLKWRGHKMYLTLGYKDKKIWEIHFISTEYTK